MSKDGADRHGLRGVHDGHQRGGTEAPAGSREHYSGASSNFRLLNSSDETGRGSFARVYG